MSNETISLTGLDRADVLAALYNASRPLGMGFMQYDPEPMGRAEAAELLKRTAYFDYLKGRVMKSDLSGDDFNPRGMTETMGREQQPPLLNSCGKRSTLIAQPFRRHTHQEPIVPRTEPVRHFRPSLFFQAKMAFRYSHSGFPT